jgi:hypothetical protein
LSLNLLAEEQQAEVASARDPVKIAILVGAVILLVTASGGIWMKMRADKRNAEAGRLQKRWDEMTARHDGGTFRSLKLLAEDFVTIHQRRMLLAPQLARIKDLMPDSIHLTRLGFKMNVELGTAATPTEAGAPAPARVQNVERLQLRLDGTAVGERAKIDAYSFADTLRTDSILSNQFKEVSLRSIGFNTSGAGTGSQTLVAQFVIECLYKESK